MKIYYSQGRYIANVPRIKKEDGYLTEGFFLKEDAEIWRHTKGVEIWGHKRWLMILDGKLTRFRNESFSVTVNDVSPLYHCGNGCTGRYSAVKVYWRNDEGKGRCKQFSEKKFGTLNRARKEAHFFAAQQRADNTGGELNLPLELYKRWFPDE